MSDPVHRIRETFRSVAAAREAAAHAALDAAVAQWRQGLDVLAAGRVRTRHGAESLEAVEHAWRAGTPSPDPGFRLSTEEGVALAALLNTWPSSLPPRRRAWVLRHLGPLGLATSRDGVLRFHPGGVVALGRSLAEPPADTLHLLGDDRVSLSAGRWAMLGELYAATAELLADEGPLAEPVRTPAERAEVLARWTGVLGTVPVRLRAQLWERWLDVDVSPAPRGALARWCREVTLGVLELGAPAAASGVPAEADVLADWLADTPAREGPRWAWSRPLALALEDDALLQRMLGGGLSSRPLACSALAVCAEVTVAAVRAGEADALRHAAEWLEGVAGESGSPLVAALRAMARQPPAEGVSSVGVLRRCAAVVAPDRRGADQALIADPLRWLEGPPWTEVLRLAGRPGLRAEVAERLRRPDVHTFDGPGEGLLPALWARALRVHAEGCAGWERLAEAVEEAGGDREEWDELGALPLAELLDPLPSPRSAAEARLEGDASPMSSYAHGLNDGIAEAYGDTWAPADPFSTRRGDG